MRFYVLFGQVILVLGVTLMVFGSNTHWAYPDRELNGTEPVWGGRCDEGKRQSPIDLFTTASFRGEFEAFKFKNYNVSLKGASFINTGHSVQVVIPTDKQIEISGGGLPGTYVFEQMHWHWWSEHRLDGLRYPLEVHMVHRNTKYANVSEAVRNKAGLAVIGVLYHVTDQLDETLSEVLVNLPKIEDKVGTTTFISEDIRPSDFIPADKIKYFRYEGSLTTPDCDESVVWTVFEDTLSTTMEQVEDFMLVRNDMGEPLKANYRSIQPSFNRAVVYVNKVTQGRSGQVRFNAHSISILTLMSIFVVLIAKIR